MLRKLELSEDIIVAMSTLPVGALMTDELTGPWVAGGIVRTLALGEALEDHDIDVWFRGLDQVAQFKQNLLECGFTERMRKQEFEGVEDWAHDDYQFTIQLVFHHLFPSMQDVVDDFSISATKFVLADEQIYYEDGALEDALAKRLVVSNESRLTEKHYRKYVDKYGYTDSHDGVRVFVEGHES